MVYENAIPCYLHDSTLPMKREGSKSHLRSKLPTMNYPEKNFCVYPGAERGSHEQEDTYKIRVNVENQSTISRIVWIKYPFWRMTHSNPKASYACLNYGEAYAPAEIRPIVKRFIDMFPFMMVIHRQQSCKCGNRVSIIKICRLIQNMFTI